MTKAASTTGPIVLATRPEPGASALVERLKTLGYHGLAAPALTQVRLDRLSIDDFSPSELDGVLALAFTSGAAVRAVGDDLGVDAIRSIASRLPAAYCVGDATAAQARGIGLRQVASADGGAKALEELLLSTLSLGSIVMHLRGEDLAHDFAPALADVGIGLRERVLYRAAPATRLPGPVASILAEGRVDAVLFLSARTAQSFRALAPAVIGVHASFAAVCISDAAAAPLSDWPAAEIVVSERPTLDAVIETLQRVAPTSR